MKFTVNKKMAAFLSLLIIFYIIVAYVPITLRPPLNNAVLLPLEKRLDADISCRYIKLNIPRSISAGDVRAKGSGGFELSAGNATLYYDPVSIITGRLHVKCDLEDVRFHRTNAIINSLTDILQIPPLGEIEFKTVRADLYVGARDTITQDLTLSSDKVKIFGNAFTDRENNIMCLLYFSLSDEITAAVPPKIRGALLKREEGHWSSLYIGIMGNYKKPRLSIMTERLRMNIQSK